VGHEWRKCSRAVALLLACGLLTFPAGPGSAVQPPAGQQVAGGTRPAAPWATPSRAVRGEQVVLRGRVGKRAGRTVRLVRATKPGWRRVATVTTRTGGRYRFVVTASAPRLTLRVQAPRAGKRRVVRTRTVVLRQWTGAEYWFADDMCRVERPPDHLVYCARRDDVLRRLGAVNARGFALAWQLRDEGAMLRLAQDPATVDDALSIRLRRTTPDCRHGESPPSWLCTAQAEDGSSTGARSEVVRRVRPRLPVWKVVAAGVPGG
jgi:hypothetical protein